MKYDICVVGSCTLDLLYYQKEDGSYNQEPDMAMSGGKASNQAVAASRAGAKTVIITKVGDDELGDSIIENLNVNGVDTSFIKKIKSHQNDYSKIHIHTKEKDNEIERFGNMISSYNVDFINECKEAIENSKIIVSQLKLPIDVIRTLIDYSKSHGKIVVLTPCRPERLDLSKKEDLEFLEKIDYITCNRNEFNKLFNSTDYEKWVEKYPKKLIVTLGKDGVIYHDGKNAVRIPAIKTNVVDTIGAGDTLNGNFSASIAAGKTFEEALKRGMYASAIEISKRTAQDGMPTKEELEEFIQINKEK